MSNEAGSQHWQCAYCSEGLRDVPAKSLPSCPYCREIQPGFIAPHSPNQSSVAGMGSPGSHQSAATHGGESTLEAGQQSSQQHHDMRTQQQIQEMQHIEERRRQQSLRHEQQQQLLYEQQLAERRRMQQQQKEYEQLQLRAVMESNSGGQQLGPDQQQQFMKQRMVHQRMIELQVLQKQQELEAKYQLGEESGEQLGHNQQQQQQMLDNQHQQELLEQQRILQQQREYEQLQHQSMLEAKKLFLDSQQQQPLHDQQKRIKEQQMLEHQQALQQQLWGAGVSQLQNASGGQQLGHDQQSCHQSSHDQQKQFEQQQRRWQQQQMLQHQGGGGHQPSHYQQRQFEQQQRRLQQQQMLGGGGHQPSHDKQKQFEQQQRRLQQQQMLEGAGVAQLQNIDGGQQLGHNQQQLYEQKILSQKQMLEQQRLLQQQQLQQYQGSGGHQLSHEQLLMLEKQRSQQLQELRLKSILEAGNGKQPSHDQHELTDEYEQNVKEQMLAWQKTTHEQDMLRQQRSLEEQRRSQKAGNDQQIGHAQHQLTESKQKIKKFMQTTSQEQEMLQQQQQRMQQHQQALKQHQRSNQNEQMAQNQNKGPGQAGDVVYCVCGTPFRPGAKHCINPGCGKPPPRNQPRGPPCVYCHKPLMKEGALRCGSCYRKQPETPTKSPEEPSTGLSPIPIPGQTYGYSYPNPPQQQPGGAVMIVSSSPQPPTSQSYMVFGETATITSYGMNLPVITRQPTSSQAYLGGKQSPSSGASSSTNTSPNIQHRQAPQGSPSTGDSGALPTNQGNDNNESNAGVSGPPGHPASARPTKDQSAGGQNSAVFQQNPHLQPDSLSATDTATQSLANFSNEQKKGSYTSSNKKNVQVDDNNKKATSEANGKPANHTTGTSVSNLMANSASGPPESQSTPKSESDGSNPADPTLDNTESHPSAHSTNDNKTYAAVLTGQKEAIEGKWHQKSKEPGHLFSGNKNVQKSGNQSSAKPPNIKVPDISGLECSDPKSCMKLVFHAIVPLLHWEWDDKSRIYIRFGHAKLGDWDKNCGEFEVARNIDAVHCEMTCTFDKFNIELLSRFKSVPYKYVIMGSPKVVDKDDCFEFLHAHSKRYGDVNRCLELSPQAFGRIHQMSPEKRVYHKYDTVIYPKKTQISKSWKETVADYASKFKGWITRKKQTGGSKDEEELVRWDFHDMHVFCLHSYLEKYKKIVCEGNFQQGTNIIELIDNVAHIINSLLRFAVHTPGYGAHTVYVELPGMNKYREEVKDWTISILNDLEDNPLQESGKQLVAAFFILACLGKNYRSYQHLKHSTMLSLIKMITLNPKPEKNSCPDYDFLRSCLGDIQGSSTCVENVRDYIGNLCKKVTGMKNEAFPAIEWMLALPLYHFLKDQSEPFGEPEYAVIWERELSLGSRTAQQKANKLENFVITHYREMEPYFMLDPLLPAVFVALTPEAEFSLLCERMPPFLTASWLTHIIVGTEKVDKKLVEKWRAQIQCIKDSLDGQNIVKELLLVMESSYQLFDFARKKTPTSEHAFSLMCHSASYILHAIARLDEATAKDTNSAWQRDDRSEVFHRMKEDLRKWVVREDVIGGSIFGGTIRKYRGKEELQYWNALLSIDAAAPQSTEDWHNIIKQLIENRIREVGYPQLCIDLVCMMEGIKNISPVLADAVMDAGYRAIDALLSEPQHSGNNEFEKLATHQSGRVGKLLGRILERQYPNANDIQAVSFDDLLGWYMWPIFITIFVSKPVLQGGIPQQYDMAGMCARSCLEGMCEKLQDGEIIIEDLQKINKNQDQMKRLCSAVSSSEEGNHLYKSVKAAVDKRLEECNALRRRIEVLSHLCRQIHSVSDKIQGLQELQAELRKDINQKAISTMCVRNEDDSIQLICFLYAGSLLKFANEFQIISGAKQGSEIFLDIWRNTLHQAITENPQLAVDDIYASVWQPSQEQCRKLLESLMDLSMKLSDVDNILKPYDSRLETQLLLLFNRMNEITQKFENPSLIDRAARRVKDYWNLRRYQEGAETFLRLKNSLRLTKGDFRLVERLSQQLSTSMKDQTLNDVDDSLVEAGRFLEDVAREPRKIRCLERFARCQDIVKWLKEVTKNVHEIQSFVNVALATAAGGEGDLSHDKLSHLRTVGSGFASLIYNFPEDAGFHDLKKACASVWEALDKNQNLPKLLEDCNKDIGWYQSVKETQGSVEVTSYGQMRNILQYGIYQIGVTGQSKLAHSIHDVVSVKLIPRDKHLTKTSYNLDELRDLESKLVLITGSKAANRKEVDHYLNILQHVTRIADVLLALQQAGNVTYSGWKISFDCATYTVIGFGEKQELHLQEETAEQRVKELHAYAKTMEEDLCMWENEVKELRSHHYELNYYTTLQLLRLRKELGLVRQNPTRSVDPQILALLESISPAVTSENVQSIISNLEKQLLDLRAAATFVPEENIEEEPANSEVPDDLNGASIIITELHTTISTATEMPSPSLSSVKRLTINNKPHLAEKDLSDGQKEILADLVGYKGYPKLLVLKGLEQSPDNANRYDIQDWCDEYEGVYKFEDEEEEVEEETTASSDESSSDSGSDDEEKVNVFDQPSLSAASPGSIKQKASSSTIVPKVKIVHRHIINESHPVVQQLVEEYEYDLEASIEAVQLFGTMERAMDYLARKDADDEGEEMITPNVTIIEPTTDESGNIIVFDDPEAEGKYLSLDQLGMVLKNLSQQLPGSVIARRTFNDELKEGAPNLLVIPSGDVLRTVLTLYMEDNNLPLPTLEEVLICNSTTTAEEINLLWQRAIGDPGNKRIFCLVHAEKLSYQVCDEVVESLKELSQGKLDYRLVILCSKEEEDKSHIVSKLLLHKKSIILNHRAQVYQMYLKNHFIYRADDSLSQATPDRASIVDCDNSSVRVVSSEQTGMGKSLYIQRMAAQLRMVSKAELTHYQVVIPIHGPVVTPDVVLTFLKEHYRKNKCMIYHFDIAPSILSEVATILFSLLVLHGLTDSQGCVWRCHTSQLYAIEVTLPEKTNSEVNPAARTIDLLSLLPTVECISPKQAMEASALGPSQVGMDDGEFRNSTFQRVYQYLRRQDRGQKLDRFKYQGTVEGNMTDCLQRFLMSCGVQNPSWSEIHHFAKFLDLQLESCEKSVFCDETFVGDVMSGLKGFVVKFMIRMSRDFATPSLEGEVARGNMEDSLVQDTNNLQQYNIEHRRRWEESSHPYIFFNDDGESITFVGFIITSKGDLVDPRRTVLEARIMDPRLYAGLKHQGVNFSDDYRSWEKAAMLQKLAMVMGVNFVHDPDETYVLTVDNLIKILAIQMRFRCGIPVVIMGETGCGKTRLIRYMCELAREGIDARNMLILKVHGGTKEEDIIKFITEAEDEAKKNKDKNMDTVVFFDEANTTDAIGLIKEILCDRQLHGRPISDDLKFIAACNPYRRHSDEMIERLEKAGLGFYVRATETQQRLGHIPLRELVYRVLDLPPSMRPLVYDFGQLKKDTEDDYIKQIVHDHVRTHPTLSKEDPGIVPAIAGVLAASQAYMRERKDECSFVSLRDVERAMIVFKYFYEKMPDFHQAAKEEQPVPVPEEENENDPLKSITSALVLAVSVCYHSRLQERGEYEKNVSSHFVPPLVLPGKETQFVNEIYWYQNVLLDNMELGPNIAKNAALRENVFMMAICIELRIPLFLVGKPGSSKSLAKSIIQDSMHGKTSRSNLLKKFKQVQMFSYQCSQLATPDSVIEVFNSAKKFQDRLDSTQFVSVVVLDEVGLAEDSPNLPLKALHPLLEDGTEGAGAKGKDEIVEREKRVAFIGISNWALDPAKMNRGVMVTRGTPDIRELEFSARGICGMEDNDQIKNKLDPYFKPLAQAYEAICMKQKKEFFGLRDFYSLIKMLYWMCKKSRGLPLTWPQMKHAIMRNFGGLKSDRVDPFQEFCLQLNMPDEEPNPDDYEEVEAIWPIINPDCSRLGLIKTSLDTRETSFHGENRYLLFLTENYAALDILKHYIRGKEHDRSELSMTTDAEGTVSQKPFTLFGSSFPKDREYTQVCRNINQIKICMETGRTVILLNLENLYESLYDVLNQYYMHYGDSRYVDLGLQTHRVKCRVHNDFKLILIAERATVYEKFPTPLINRLEKHFVLTSSVLKEWQQEVLNAFKEWIKGFSRIRDHSGKGNFKEGHAFVGYQKDTPAAVVFQASKQLKKLKKGLSDRKSMNMLTESGILGDISPEELTNEYKGSDMWKEAVLRLSQYLLLQTASDDSLVRLKMSDLRHQQEELMRLYFSEQHHNSIADFVYHHIQNSDGSREGLLLQVTTHGHILLREELMELVNMGAFIDMKIESFLLQEFDTELDFSNKVGPLFQRDEEDKQNRLLVIQCDSGHLNGDLIACARYRVYDERINALNRNKIQHRDGVTHVLFIINLPHQVSTSSFVGFQGDPWISAHIDDLRPTSSDTIEPLHAIATSISDLFIGGYIQDIAPLLGTTQYQRQISESESEESFPGEDETVTPTQVTPLHDHDVSGEADIEDEGSESEDDIGEHQMEPDLQARISTPELPPADHVQPLESLEQLAEFPGQSPIPFEPTIFDTHQERSFQEQEGDESSTELTAAKNNLTSELVVIDIEEDEMEFPTVSVHQGSPVIQNMVPVVTENSAYLESMNDDRHQDGLSLQTFEPVEDEHTKAALASMSESVTQSQAILLAESDVLQMPAEMKMEGASNQEVAPTPLMIQKSAKRQIPSGQCRRLYSCIQAAASKLEDSTKDRSTQRVTRLTKLIQRYPDHLNPRSFHGTLVTHIYRLLKEREADRPDLTDWVLGEALNASNLEVGGTFRNVLARKIDEVVIPIFAKIIASIDRNYNLDLINPKAGDSPLAQFWLAMFREPKVQQLRYSEMVQGGKVPGLGGRKLDQDFKCQLPFFWLIKDAVDSQWDNARSQAGVNWQMHHEQLCMFVRDTPVGAILESVESENCEDFYKWYLHDFVMSVHRCKHKNSDLTAMELQLVSDALDRIVHCSVFQHKSLTSMIVALHLAYGTNKSHILWFNQLVSHSPGIMYSLQGMLPSNELPEMELHLYATEKMMEKLEPPLKKDNPNPNLAQWLNHVRLSQNTIDSILSIRSQSERVLKARQSWYRLRATQLFVEQVMLKHPDVDLKLLARRLCGRWEKNCDFLKVSTVSGVQLQLNSMEKTLKKECDDKKRREVKRSCRGFFMEVVSDLCFKGQAAPEPDLVRMLLDTVFMEKDQRYTQELTPYKDDKSAGDKIPTVRSFLLQLLLEHSMEQVRDHLRDYLDRSYRVLVGNHEGVTDQNLYLLIIQCFEDALCKRLSTQNVASSVEEVTTILIEGYNGLLEHRHGTPTLEYLEGVAKVRYSLSIVAGVLKNEQYGHHFVELIRAAGRMCSDREVNCIDPTGRKDTVGPVIYLLKLIVRQYGMPYLRAAAEIHEWLIPAQLKSTQEKSVDPFVIYGDLYKGLREALNDAMYGNQTDALDEATQTLKPCEVPYLLLALYEKATLSRTTDNPASRISDDALERLNDFVMNYQLFSNELRFTARALLANQQGGRILEQMFVSPRQPLQCRTVLGVVVHAAAVFFGRQKVDVLLPFVNMLNNPALLNQSYLPTMQEDPLIESQAAMVAGDRTGQFYECPNGHKYFIGNCGRTYYTGVCNVCKSPIGGTSGNPVTGNKLTNTQDTTKKGHDLGAPKSRTHASPERNLSARAVCILRALMHSAFVWASCNNEPALEAIAGLVTPQVLPQNLPEFFWAHLEKDLELLGRDTGKGLDEVVMIMHLVLRHILTTDPPIGGTVQTVSSLEAKEARKEWERIFNQHYIQPVLSTLDDNLAIAMDRVANDERQDHDQLFYLVYEKVKYTEESLEPHLWTYRSRITLEHLRQTLQEKKMKEKYPILHEFLQAEAELRATQYLPDIARLQQCLYDRFNRQIDRKDVKKQTIQAFIKELPNETTKNDYREMISSVKAAWALVGQKLKNHGRLPVEEKFYIAAINDNTTMEYLVPTTSEAGVCTTALVDFLTLTHNNFIERCRVLVAENDQSTLSFWREHKVPITHLHRCHLLDYEHQLPSIILSHCHYSLKVGRGQDVKYDHQALEKHILNRFIHGKPLVLLDIPQVVYRKDIYTTGTFADVRKKVEPQEKLQQRVRQDIVAELRTPDRLREALDVVEIVLGFLSSGGGKADKLLGEYIDKTLRMKKRRFSQKAKSSCQLKHALSLWETIAVELARQLCLRGQEPFDSIRQEFLCGLSKDEDGENQFEALDRCLGQFDPDLLLGTLYEFIETYVKHCPLQEHDQPLVVTLELVLDQYGTELPQLAAFPASIKLNQAVAAWKHIVHYYAKRH